MIVNQKRDADRLTVTIEGRLDTVSAPELEEKLPEFTEGVSELILDMKGLEYVSSAGLRVILKAQKLMNAKGAMKLIGVNETVMEVFSITGFADILNFGD